MGTRGTFALVTIAVLVALVAVLAGLLAATGAYNVAADAPHAAIVRQIIGYVRERSIEARAQSVRVPRLTDPRMIAEGAAHYAAMCTGCHLAPGKADNEIRQA